MKQRVKRLAPKSHDQEVAEPPNHVIRKLLKQTETRSSDPKPHVLFPIANAS